MSTQSDLAELYTTFFNRAPDADGLAYWVDSIDSGQLSLTQIAENWLTEQPEGQTNFPTTLTDAQFVAKIYTNVLSRTADADGAQYWLDQLASGAVTRDSFALSIINGAKANTSAQGVLDATLISNKATVGVAFAEQGVNDTALAAKVLTTVTADASTLNSTLAVIALIPSSAAAQTPAILAATDQLLTNFANLIAAAPGELADATTYLQTLAAGITSGTNITTLLSNANTLITSAATNSAALDNPAVKGAADVVVATPGTGGTPSPTTILATAGLDAKTLTAGADTFVTKFGGESVKQVDTIGLGGIYEVGDTITISGVATAAVVFTVTDVSTLTADLAAAINAAPGSAVVATVSQIDDVVLTAKTAGTGFTAVATAANKPAVPAVKQVDTITLGGTYEAGDTITITGVATSDVTVTVVDPSLVAAEIIAAVNAATGKTVVAASTDSTHVTLTSSTAGTPFTAIVSAANKATVPAVQQVDTITVSGTYEAGDTVTITGVASADVVVTVGSPSSAASDIISAVNQATGKTVNAAAGAANEVTLTASVAGIGFTANVSAANKPAVDAVKQVDTVQIASVYAVNDTITITGVASNDIVFTVSDPTTVSADLVAFINAAGGLTVEADVVDATNVTLTALTAGTPFTASATDDLLEASVEITTPNQVAVPAGADTQTISSSNTTANAAVVIGDNTQAVNLAHTTVNQVAVVGTDDQTASVVHTKVNLVAAESLSAVGTLDVLTGFTPGTDKVELFTFGGPVTSPSALTHVADVTAGTDLVTQLAAAFSGVTAGNAGLVTIAAGNVNAGTYLFANDNNDAFSATDDVVIKLVGVTLPSGTGSINVADYFVGSPSV